MIFALCTSLRKATAAQLADPDYCKQFIGALWIPEFIRKMEALGHVVRAGNEVVKGPNLYSDWLYNVIQEDRTPEGRALLKRGANGQVLICMESPMYVPTFYDAYERLAAQYAHCVTFKSQATFPSFSQSECPPHLKPWGLRRPICAIVSNKHYSQQRVKLHRSRSPSWKKAIECQLHDARYQAIAALRRQSYLDLFGHGWPPGYALPVADKIEVMRNYKYALAFENIAMPGYCTEKLIHCFVAGVRPIYLGDPTIRNRVPPELYIDFSAYSGWDSVIADLQSRDGKEEMRRISEARAWLKSAEGHRWSYEGMAEDMVKKCIG